MEKSKCEPAVNDPSWIVPTPTILNVVSSVNLDCKLDLSFIALKAPNSEYKPKRGALIMRLKSPKTTAMIYASGKMVCMGAKSEESSEVAARKFARIIHELGFPAAKFKDFKIQNMVASCDVNFRIHLERLATSYVDCTFYEPQITTGLTYRMKRPKVVLRIYHTGKIVLMGAKAMDEIYTAFENIYTVLTECPDHLSGAEREYQTTPLISFV